MMGVLDVPQQLRARANRHSGLLMLVGLAGLGLLNWRRWKFDGASAQRVRTERAPVPKRSHTPKISVLVAAWNEGTRIDDHLRSFTSLEYPEIEVILGAGGNDDTLERARKFANERITVLEQKPGDGKQRTLARCLERASGEIIYLTDADCRYSDEAIEHLLAALINEGEDVATGNSCPLGVQHGKILPHYVWSADQYSAMQSPRYIEGLLGRNTILTRRAINACGGLDFVAPTGTDYHLARRLLASGIAIRSVPTSMVESQYPETLQQYWQKQSRWLRNLLLYGGSYGAYHQVRNVLRTATIGGGMLILAPVSVMFGRAAIATWLLLFANSVIAKVRYAAFTNRVNDTRISVRYLLALLPFTLVEFVVWVSPVVQLFDQRRRERW